MFDITTMQLLIAVTLLSSISHRAVFTDLMIFSRALYQSLPPFIPAPFHHARIPQSSPRWKRV